MNSFIRLTIFVTCLLSSFFVHGQQNYYWVGGGGNWSDISHWATSSGGSVHYDVVPNINDNVIFDANSGFSSGNQYLSLDGQEQYCNNMKWVGAPSKPTISGAVGSTLNVGGNLELQSDMTYSVYRTQFTSNGQATITTQGVLMKGGSKNGLILSGNGDFIFEDDITLESGFMHSGSGDLFFRGRFHNVSDKAINKFYGTNTTTFNGDVFTSTKIDMQNGSFLARNINVVSREAIINVSGSLLDISNSEITCTGWKENMDSLNAVGSHVIIKGFGGFSGSAGKAYNDISLFNYGTFFSLPNGSANTVLFLGSGTIITGGSNFNRVIFRDNGSINGSNTFANLMLSVSKIYTFRAGSVQTIEQVLTANALPCTGLIELRSSIPGVQAKLNFADMAITDISSVLLQDMAVVSDLPITVNNSFDAGNNTGFVINQIPESNLYWIGGAGNWNDASHWTTNSDGTSSGGCVPTPANNVIFNQYSGFTSESNIVNLDGQNHYCKDMSWSGAFSHPSLIGGNKKVLFIDGSLSLQPEMEYIVNTTIFTSDNTATVETKDVELQGSEIIINGNGNFTFLDNLTVRVKFEHHGSGDLTFDGMYTNKILDKNYFFGSGTTTFKDDINIQHWMEMKRGDFIARDINVTAGEWIKAFGKSLDISNSNIVAKHWEENTRELNAIGSHITVHGTFGFNASIGKAYHDLTLSYTGLPFYLKNGSANNVVFTKFGRIKTGGGTFNKVTFEANGEIEDSNTFGELTLSAGMIYTLASKSTQTINQKFTANALPCTGLIELKSNKLGAKATMHFGASSIIDINSLMLQDIEASGNVPVIAGNSFDAGNNTGFSISESPNSTLYWIGGSGNWNDSSHWTTNDDGTPSGGCVPTPANDVVFNEYSGFMPGDSIVELDGQNHYCKDMTWQGALSNPILKSAWRVLIIGGDLTLQSGMTYDIFNTIFTSDQEARVITNEVEMMGYPYSGIEIKGNGNYAFVDDFTIRSGFTHNGDGDIVFQGMYTNVDTTCFNRFFGLGTTTFNKDVSVETTIELRNGSFVAPNIKFSSLYWTKVSGNSLDIENTSVQVYNWEEDVMTLSAADSHIRTGDFKASSEKAYNDIVIYRKNASFYLPNGSVDTVLFEKAGKIKTGGGVFNDLTFEDDGGIEGDNSYGNLTLGAGHTYTLTSNTTQTINNNFYPSGNNCFKTDIKSSSAGLRANIKVLSGNTVYDFVKIQDINAEGSYQELSFEMHSEDYHNNSYMMFAPPGTEDLKGLGLDVIDVEFPHTITTEGFFPNPQTTFLWNDGSTGSTLTVTTPGIYTCTATYGDGCQVTSSMHVFSTKFMTVWKTDNVGASEDTQIYYPGIGSNYTLSWEKLDDDGNPMDTGIIYGVASSYGAPKLLDFSSTGAGTYRITAGPGLGTFTGFRLGKSGNNRDDQKLINVAAWGDIPWTSLTEAFYNASNMTMTASDQPDLSRVTDLSDMFNGASVFNTSINHWSVDKVEIFTGMFKSAALYDQAMEEWNVGEGVDFEDMFSEAVSFNKPLDSWNVSHGRNFRSMFSGATAFDQNLGYWKLKSAINLKHMLDGCGLSKLNYDKTLIGWMDGTEEKRKVNGSGSTSSRSFNTISTNTDTPDNLELGATGLVYVVKSARAGLIEDKGWIIIGDEPYYPALITPSGVSMQPTISGDVGNYGQETIVEVIDADNGSQTSVLASDQTTFSMTPPNPMAVGPYTGTVTTIHYGRSYDLVTSNGEIQPSPVVLIKFEAEYSDGKINLFWATASEVNNDYYTIEKLNDAGHWESFAQVEGYGTYHGKTEYIEIDKNPHEGVNYYRLSQTDFDGTSEKLGISKALVQGSKHSSIVIYPNPVADRIFINGILKGSQIKFYNLQGENVLNHTKVAYDSRNLASVDLKNLASGVYFIHINDNVFKIYKN